MQEYAENERIMDSITAEQIRSLIMQAGLNPPRRPTLMITSDCNLHCRHCWPQCGVPAKAPPVPLEKLQTLIVDFVQLGANEICLTGGEPLVHPSWLDILRFSCKVADLKSVCMQTNGTLLTQKIADNLTSDDLKKLTIQISLDGAAAETHDRLRGKGSFKRAFRGIKLLAAAGLGERIRIAFTETRDSFQEIPQLLEILDDLGIKHLTSGTLVLAGRAAQDPELALPTPSQIQELLERFHEDKAFKKRYERMGNIACIEWFKGKATPSAQHCACIETPYIAANGTMYPCEMLPMEKFAVRNVYENPAENIFFKAVRLWSELPAMYRQRMDSLEECKDCPGRRHCAGGCMGRAFAVHGNPITMEDRCALRKTVYRWKPSNDFS